MRIGVYRVNDPLATLPARRIEALLDEAARQNVQLFFFEASGIDADGMTLEGAYREAGEMRRGKFPLPDAVLNERPGISSERPEAETRLREKVPFITHLIHDKLEIYRKLKPAFGEWLLPCKPATGFEKLLLFVEQYRNVILKPVPGRKGDHICLVRAAEGKMYYHDGQREEAVSPVELKERFLSLQSARNYLMQQYWPVLTERGEPTDFRIHVQRGEDGRWHVAKLYPRIGRAGALVSHIGQGGVPEPIDEYLRRQCGLVEAEGRKRRLADTALRLAAAIDGCYPFMIDELGIDLLMNDRGEVRFLEADSGPETGFYEEERAPRTIGFAKYVARAFRGERPGLRPMVGMLHAGLSSENRFREACALAANAHGADLYCLLPADVEFACPIIKGYRLCYGVWEPHYIRSPDVVYDRLKRRGVPSGADVYRRLSEVPFTEMRKSGSSSKLRQYRQLKGDPQLQPHVIPFVGLNDVARGIRFMERHRSIVIKPSVGSLGAKTVVVEREEHGWTVTDRQHAHRLSDADMLALLHSLVGKKGYLMQKCVPCFTQAGLPYYIRVHFQKNAARQWVCIEPLLYLSADPSRNRVNHATTFWVYSSLERMLKHEFVGREAEVSQRIRALALSVAEAIERSSTDRLCELGIDLGMDEREHLWIFEANTNRVGVDYREMEIANIAIPAAIAQISFRPGDERKEMRSDETSSQT